MSIFEQVYFRDKKGIFWFFCLVFFLTIPFSQFFSARILVLILLSSFFVGNSKNISSRFFSQAWDVVLFLLPLILGLIYSEDLGLGLRVLETSFSLFAIPFVFCRIENFGKKSLHQTLYVFTLGLIIASFLCIISALIRYNKSDDIHVFFFDQLTQIINSQPTYLAYYLIASITFGLYLLYYEKLTFPKIWVVVALVFLFGVLMLTGGLTAFISMLLVLSYFALKFLMEEKTKSHTITFALVVCMLGFMFFFQSLQDNSLTVKSNDYWERIVLWESALKASPNFLFGVGTGDYKVVLNEYYVSHNLSQFADKNFNAHNQFIQTFFSNGLIGLLFLIIMVIRPIYLSVRNQNILGTLIFFPFLIYGMTEVFLGRYQGVVFFALLHQAFISLYQSQTPTFALKE